MRYLIILLAVVALALPAGTARAQCADGDTIYAEDCGDLPQIGRPIQSQGCFVVEWTFEFFRTSDTSDTCIVVAEIKGTNVAITINSGKFVPCSRHSISGMDVVTGSPVQAKMKHDPIYNAPGLFSKLKLSYRIY